MSFTVGELKLHLKDLSDETEVSFDGGLTFYRARYWENEVFIEFNEPQAHLTPEFKTKNPGVKVAFINVDLDENEVIQQVNVTVK